MPELTKVGLSLFALGCVLKTLYKWDMFSFLEIPPQWDEKVVTWFNRGLTVLAMVMLAPLGPAVTNAGHAYLKAWHVLDDQGREANRIVASTINQGA